MKKLLSVLLCLAMLLCSFAMAESAEIKLSNLKLVTNGESVFDLTGIDMGISVIADEEEANGGMRLFVDADGSNVLNLVFALTDEALVLTMTGVSNAYSIDMADLKLLISSIDVSGGLTVQGNGNTAMMSEEDQQRAIELGGRILALIAENTVELPDEEIDGVVYSVVSVNVSEEQLAPLLKEMAGIMDNYSYLLEGSGVNSFTQAFEMADLGISLGGKIYDSEYAGIIDFDVNLSAAQGTENVLLNLYIAGSGDAEDAAQLDIAFTVKSEEEENVLSMTLDIGVCDASWMPAEGIETIDILTMTDTQVDKLSREAGGALIMALSRMAAENDTVARLLVSMMN